MKYIRKKKKTESLQERVNSAINQYESNPKAVEDLLSQFSERKRNRLINNYHKLRMRQYFDLGKPKTSLLTRLKEYKYYYLLLLPGLLYLVIFKIYPMLIGMRMAFYQYYPHLGFENSEFVGWKYFIELFESGQMSKMFINTLMINISKLVLIVPVSLSSALFFNEIRLKLLKTSQILSYFPYFLSWVMVFSIIFNFFNATDGVINNAIYNLTGDRVAFLSNENYFLPMIVGSHIWKNAGWTSIMFTSALTWIDPEIYEAAAIDGANYWQKLKKITLPFISIMIAFAFLFQIAFLFNGDFEQLLMFIGNDSNLLIKFEIFETYAYRMATSSFGSMSSGMVVTLLQGMLGLTLMTTANAIIKRKLGYKGIW